jgi:hypothetical protein
MSEQINQDANFLINQQGYAAFDAVSLKQLIIDRLNAGTLYTDQNYEGSNISAIIDIVAYAYHVLLFYLNRTASESLFSQATLYENINKIVKELNYKPIGYQSALLSFRAQALKGLSKDTYTIKRYSYFTVNGITYSFNNDVTFVKTGDTDEVLTLFSDNNLLYQGSYVEYPTYTAIGDDYETLTISFVANNVNQKIDHFNIDVYVKEKATGKYFKYTETASLFLNESTARVFEKRLNENERYEIKFGNGITGRKLEADDEVAIYFLQTDSVEGEIDIGILDGNKLFLYESQRYNSILTDTISVNLNLLTDNQTRYLSFINIEPSTKFQDKESADAIKTNAPKIYNSQYRLVTASDYEVFVNRNFANIISSAKAVNNWTYLNGHFRYFYDLQLNRPNNDSRVLFNQVKFADTCDFNNVYIYGVPRLDKITSLTQRTNYLNAAQKELILNTLQNYKTLTAEIIVTDPVYVGVDFGIKRTGEILTPDITSQCKLVITKNVLSQIDNQSIKNNAFNIIKSFFDSTNNSLGILFNINDLTTQIFNIKGVQDFYIQRTDENGTFTVPGLNFLVWNPVYPDGDIQIVSQNYQFPYFKYPFLNNPLDLVNKIEVITTTNVNSKIEY